MIMKVLFAMGNDQVSTNVANRYYEKYGEVLEYKNVFFFKALIEEVKRDKTYDRIVISEELEQFRAKDLEQVDRYLFNSIDKITDEIQDSDIIFICSDRREKGDAFVSKLFSIGIYNLLLGDDRNVNPLCEIIKKPKNKREAKQYLNIDASSIVNTSMTTDDEVDEFQMRSILSFYEGIRNQPEKYLETFDRIAEQYSRKQLKIIVSMLPKQITDVVLQADRYKYLSSSPHQDTPAQVAPQTQVKEQKPKTGGFFGVFRKYKVKQPQPKVEKQVPPVQSIQQGGQVDLSSNEDEQKQADLMARAREEAKAREKAEAEAKRQAELAAKARAEAEAKKQAELAAKAKAEVEARQQAELAAKAKAEAEARQQAELAAKAKAEAEAKQQAELAAKAKAEAEARQQAELAAKAKAEAEAKHKAELDKIAAERREKEKLAELAKIEEQEKINDIEKAKKDAELAAKERLAQMTKDENVIIEVKPNLNAPDRPVEPVKNVQPVSQKISDAIKANSENKQQDTAKKEEVVKNIQENKNANSVANENPQQNVKPNPVVVSEDEKRMKVEQEKLAMEQKRIKEEQAKLEEEKKRLREEQEKLINAQNQLKANATNEYNVPQYTNTPTTTQIAPLDYKKMVVFVGANKVGTTFMTNAIAHSMANAKINTSILDMTRDRSMFYLYNQNDKTLRKRAEECMQKVMDGDDCYLETTNRYLKVYTTIPGTLTDPRRGYKHKAIIETVKSNCNLTIVDADFTTPIDYFDQANEVYLVQDLDLLKMPDTTLFLRELKNRGMDMKKIRIIINKYVKTSLSQKQIVQTLSSYSDPSMSFYDTVLPGKVMSYLVPYNLNNYAKYVDSVCSGVLSYKGYSADFMQAIDEIGSAIFPKNNPTGKTSRRFFG